MNKVFGDIRGTDYRQICWLASYPKSGNTWTRLFLDAYYLGEVDINEVLTSVGDDVASRYQIGDGSQIQKMPIQIQQLARPMAMLRVVREYVRAQASHPLFMKTHSAHMITNGMEQLPEQLTKATVCLVRDPRDVLPSFANHMGAESLDEAIEWMCEKYRALNPTEFKVYDFTSSWELHTRSFLDADTHNVMIVKYEDLRANPVQQFGNILQHCGVEPDIERVERAVELTKLSRLKKQEDDKGFREASSKAKKRFFNKGAVGGWKDLLTARQLNKIERKWGRTMKRLGYLNKVST